MERELSGREAGFGSCHRLARPSQGCRRNFRAVDVNAAAASTGLAGAPVRGLSYRMTGTERQQMSNDGLARREAVCPGDVESR